MFNLSTRESGRRSTAYFTGERKKQIQVNISSSRDTDLTGNSSMICFSNWYHFTNKNAFQQDAYRPLQWPSVWGECVCAGGVPKEGGDWPGRGVTGQGCVWPGGVCLGECMCLLRGVCQGCVSGQRGVSGWGCTPPCGHTDTSENITFPQLLLRTVIRVHRDILSSLQTVPKRVSSWLFLENNMFQSIMCARLDF